MRGTSLISSWVCSTTFHNTLVSLRHFCVPPDHRSPLRSPTCPSRLRETLLYHSPGTTAFRNSRVNVRNFFRPCGRADLHIALINAELRLCQAPGRELSLTCRSLHRNLFGRLVTLGGGGIVLLGGGGVVVGGTPLLLQQPFALLLPPACLLPLPRQPCEQPPLDWSKLLLSFVSH